MVRKSFRYVSESSWVMSADYCMSWPISSYGCSRRISETCLEVRKLLLIARRRPASHHVLDGKQIPDNVQT
jgi:hypothetical protein